MGYLGVHRLSQQLDPRSLPDIHTNSPHHTGRRSEHHRCGVCGVCGVCGLTCWCFGHRATAFSRSMRPDRSSPRRKFVTALENRGIEERTERAEG